MTTHTAWLATDPETFADCDYVDVSVVPNDEEGATTGETVFQADTSVRLDSGDDEAAMEEAHRILADAGWRITEYGWTVVPNGYAINVEQV